MGALYKGLIVTGVLSAIVLWPITDYMIGMNTTLTAGTATFTGVSLFWCGIVGLLVTAAIVWATEYYTGTEYRPVKSVAQASTTGHGTNVIQGRSEEHTSELQSLMRISYAVFCLKKKKKKVRYNANTAKH